MKFLWTTILVNNMDESLKFYEEIVGLKLTERFQAGPGMEISFLGEGETKVELISFGSIPASEMAFNIDLDAPSELGSGLVM
jgi:lactoylglutathione lyase